MNIGHNIKRIRQWKQIPQKEISDVTGIPQGTLSKIEGGSDVLWSKLISISSALSVSIEDLILFDANKVTFNMTGDKANGMVINQNNTSENKEEIIKIMRDENLFLRKMLGNSIKNKLNKKQT